MAKIDVSKIEGFEGMSESEKLNALQNYEFEVPAPETDNAEITKLQRLLSKANSEAADFKKQLREKQTETERAEAERAEADKALREELEALRKDKTVASYQAKYLALGYDADLAASTAAAMASGDFDTVFANQALFGEKQKQAYDAAALNKQPGLSPGQPPQSKQIEDQFVAAFRKAAMGK